jgi:Fe-Mn family superoxide dismutase
MNKREFLKKSFAIGAGAMVSAPLLQAFSKEYPANHGTGAAGLSEGYPFKQYDLGYAYDALEPHVDAKTMELHYSKHHAGYTRKFNAAVENEDLKGESLKDIFARVSSYSDSIRNNGGGYYNHNLYWRFMSPNGGGKPGGPIAKAIDQSFGSFDAFKKKFSSVSGSQFGSGWGWLVLDNNGDLVVTSTPNQDNPLMDVAEVQGMPLLNIDVWEHAYYLNYQNRRGSYIEAYWNLINWDYVEELYQQVI